MSCSSHRIAVALIPVQSRGAHSRATGTGESMARVFDSIMRVVSSLIGLVLFAMGSVWILQGLNLAFRVGFMVGDKRWTFYGAILAVVGIAQIVWTLTRRRGS